MLVETIIIAREMRIDIEQVHHPRKFEIFTTYRLQLFSTHSQCAEISQPRVFCAEYAKLTIPSCAFGFGVTHEICDICEKSKYADEP